MSLITSINNGHDSYRKKETKKRKRIDDCLDALHPLHDFSGDFQALKEDVKHLTGNILTKIKLIWLVKN